MYMNDTKRFTENETERKTLILSVRIYFQYIGMEFGIEKLLC